MRSPPGGDENSSSRDRLVFTGPVMPYQDGPKPNAVHFAIRMAALKSMRVVGCGVRGRNG